MSDWLTLRQRALDDAHASWFAGIPPDLLARARTSDAGRRWMARHLAAQRVLFHEVTPGDSALVAGHDWLCEPLAQRDGFMLALGAEALAPLIRTRVLQRQVRMLTAVVGENEYERILAMPASEAAPGPSPAGAERVSFESEEGLRDGLLAEAAAQLHALASGLSHAIAARVRLLFARDDAVAEPFRSLPAGAVAACAARHPGDPGAAHG